jgi:hypothetical protein
MALLCRCECAAVCSGEQFYCFKRTLQKRYYEETHHRSLIDNAELCHQCYVDLSKSGDPGVESISRKFSRRNGFGPVSVVPAGAPAGFDLMSPVVPECSPMREAEIRYVLSQLTVAEESAIRMVAPLASIVRLKHGNVGRKGTVACVWQDQKNLTRVLPSLPKDCKTLVIRYDKKNGQLASFKCRRYWIARALRLLKATDAEPWSNIDIDEDRLAQWPVEGNLMDLADKIDVSTDIENAVKTSIREDESSLGPAPCQNHECRQEEFVGVVMNNEVVDATGNAKFANDELAVFGGGTTVPVFSDDLFAAPTVSTNADPLPPKPLSPARIGALSPGSIAKVLFMEDDTTARALETAPYTNDLRCVLCTPAPALNSGCNDGANTRAPVHEVRRLFGFGRKNVTSVRVNKGAIAPRKELKLSHVLVYTPRRPGLVGGLTYGDKSCPELSTPIREQCGPSNDNTLIPEVTILEDGHSAAVDSSELLPKGTFVNMKSFPWA